jgi:glycine cleavage system protein P-like pyridoxal-binding family
MSGVSGALAGRRVGAAALLSANYIARRMPHFFDLLIVDEQHSTK